MEAICLGLNVLTIFFMVASLALLQMFEYPVSREVTLEGYGYNLVITNHNKTQYSMGYVHIFGLFY